jgi:hypothetical protein
VYVYLTPFLHIISDHPYITTSTYLLLKCIAHTQNGTDIYPSIELLSEHIARYVHAYGGTGLVVTLHTSAVAAGGSEGRLARGTCRGRDVETVAACCCCADAGGSGDVPEPWCRGAWDSSCRGAGSEEGKEGDFGAHGCY